MKAVSKLHDPQCELLLFRNCAGVGSKVVKIAIRTVKSLNFNIPITPIELNRGQNRSWVKSLAKSLESVKIGEVVESKNHTDFTKWAFQATILKYYRPCDNSQPI